MRKIISRILVILILAIMLTEFSFSNVCNAAQGIDSSTINTISNLIGGVVSIIIWIPKLIFTGILWVFSKISLDNIAGVDGKTATSTIITPFDIFFNNYKLLDINFFDVEGAGSGSISGAIRSAVAKWFVATRLIAAAILLAILIYVGIRMALSTVASDRVKYRKMFFDWACSLVLIFVLHYMAVFIIYLNNTLVNMLKDIMTDVPDLGEAINRIVTESLVGIGISGIMAFLVYVMITVQTFFFFVAYVNRMLKVGFLILISPLISVTYSIDKMGDGKAQALGSWLKEFVYTILIQPFDCIMYMAFVNAATALLVPDASSTFLSELGLNAEVNELANGVLAILCLKFINDGEKIIRKIFNFQDNNSSTSMAAGAALGLMAVQRAQKAAKTGKKFVGKGSPLQKAFKSDNKLLKNYDWYNKATDKIGNLGEKLSSTKAGQVAGKAVGLAKKTINGVSRKKKQILRSKTGRQLSRMASRSSALALGAMGAAMMYASGDSGALESFAAGAKIDRIAAGRFQASMNTLVGGSEGANQRLEEDAEKKNEEEYNKQIDEVEKDLANHGVTEGDINNTDELDRKANQAEKDFLDLKAKRDRLDEIQAKMTALNGLNLVSGLSDEQKQEYAELDKERKELEKIDLSDEAIDSAENKADIARAISNAAIERKRLIAEKAKFYSPEEVLKRAQARTRKVEAGELNAQASSIMALILQLQKELESGDIDEVVESEGKLTVSDEEYDKADRMTQKLAREIDRQSRLDKKFDTQEYMQEQFGVTAGTDPNSTQYRLAMAIEKYRQMTDQNVIAKMSETADTLGLKSKKFAEELAETTSDNRRYRS